MTLFLASVRDAAEADVALRAGADIIDLKDPERGALGALCAEAIAACVRCIARRAPVSATIGDVPLRTEAVLGALRTAAALGVDYVKLGLFPGSDANFRLDLSDRDTAQLQVVFVLFADALPAFDAIGLAARAGASGVMFDTLGKRAGALTDHLPPARLAAHIAVARALGLTVGLAGSLKAESVADLLGLRPNLLGFRGALCRDGDRVQTLDPVRLAAIRALIPSGASDLREPYLPNLAAQAMC
jgi:uncharacterized protein (UPF0264 family)